MNKRIQELMQEADLRCSETRGVYDIILAELIVRECISKVKLRREFAIEDEHHVDEAFSLLVYDIESHFGVEE